MIEYDVRFVAPPLRALSPMTAELPPAPSPFPRRPADRRFAGLGVRYALPAPNLDDGAPAGMEAAALCEAGLGEVAYAACHLVCALRCSVPGTPLALGLWSSSALLSWCGATWATDAGDDGVAAQDHALFLTALRTGTLGPPRLLVPAPLDDAALDSLGAQLPDYALTSDSLPGGAHRLVLTPAVGDAGMPDAAEMQLAPAVAIDVLPSRLGRAMLLAQRWVERLGGPWIGPRDVPPHDDVTGALLGSGWLRLQPELPQWACTAPVGLSGAVDLFEHWRALAPESSSAEAIAALHARAGLVWRLAYLAAQDPRAGWTALLATCDAGALAAVTQGARAAGYTLLPPSVLYSGIDWEPDGESPALRAGLACIPGAMSFASGIVAERARGGPFTSLFDLARRIPALRAAPDLLRRLVVAGAADDLHERGVVLGNWPAIAAWCRAPAEAGMTSSDAAPEPEAALDPAMAVDATQLAIWSRALSPLLAAPDGDAAIPRQIDDALLPSAVLAAPPPIGEPLRVAGVVLARREIRRDAQALTLLQVGDGAASIILLGEANDESAQEDGAWVAIDAVRSDAHAALVFVAARLATPRPPRTVEVVVPRLGDRDADLARLLQVQELLGRHPGGDTVHLSLLHAGRRRRLDTGAPLTVAWSPALREELETVLGPDTVELLPIEGQDMGCMVAGDAAT